jgi:hypothetical protein
VLRALWPYLIVSYAISGVGGLLYDGGDIGVPATYGLLILAIIVSLVGYERWDKQHYG